MSKSSYFKRALPKILITLVILGALIYVAFFWSNYEIKKRLPVKFEQEVKKYSAVYGLDEYFVYAVIAAESSFDPEAESPVGAKGLMQLMPSTAEWLIGKYKLEADSENLFDADNNILLGCCYLAYLNKCFDNNPQLVLAAYNGGEGNVRKWLQNELYSEDGKSLSAIPYKETANYVEKVSTYYEIYKDIYK